MPEKSGFLIPYYNGECIYCHSSDGLTTEHIIPKGLGGTWTIPEASCERCRLITQHFEQKALRHTLGPGRYKLGISGDKRKRPKTWPAYRSDAAGEKIKIEIPLSEIPFFFPLPVYPTIPITKNLISNNHEQVDEIGYVMTCEDQSIVNQTLNKFGAKYFHVEIDYSSFARMLAKIAMGYCRSTFGVGEFISTLNLFVLGEVDCYEKFVGSSVERLTEPTEYQIYDNQVQHRLSHFICETEAKEVCVKIDLFIHLRAPSYYVLAGAFVPGRILRWRADTQIVGS